MIFVLSLQACTEEFLEYALFNLKLFPWPRNKLLSVGSSEPDSKLLSVIPVLLSIQQLVTTREPAVVYFSSF